MSRGTYLNPLTDEQLQALVQEVAEAAVPLGHPDIRGNPLKEDPSIFKIWCALCGGSAVFETTPTTSRGYVVGGRVLSDRCIGPAGVWQRNHYADREVVKEMYPRFNPGA